MTGESPWWTCHKSEFPASVIPFGSLVYYKPPNTSSNPDGKWDPDARKGIFAGYVMRTVFEWGKGYKVWDLESFKTSDLRTCASHKHQRVGEPLVVGRCEIPANGTITFPLKAHYDSVNLDIFNPLLIEPDPEAGEESDEAAILARAPQDLDARIVLEVAPPEKADEPELQDGPLGGMETPIAHTLEPPPMVPPPMADVHHEILDEDGTPEGGRITDVAWLTAFKQWSKNVSSEEVKQKVVTIMNAPDVKGYTTRGVTVCSVPAGSQAHLITSRHHVPSQAEYRRTALQVREEDDWYWDCPVEHWVSLPDPIQEVTVEGFTLRYIITIFYDKNKEDDTPTYIHKSRVEEDKSWTDITLADDGRLCRKDMAGRWRTVDESGTGCRAGSTRPPDVPADAFEFLRRGHKKDDPSSLAVPASAETGLSPSSLSRTSTSPRIAIDVGGVLCKYHSVASRTSDEWWLSLKSEVPRAILSLRELVSRFGADNTFIISKAGPRMAKLTKYWLLEIMSIDEVAGFNPDNIHFCAKVSGPRGKGKLPKLWV